MRTSPAVTKAPRAPHRLFGLGLSALVACEAGGARPSTNGGATGCVAAPGAPFVNCWRTSGLLEGTANIRFASPDGGLVEQDFLATTACAPFEVDPAESALPGLLCWSQGGPPRLYRNLGAMRFADITEGAGLPTRGGGALSDAFNVVTGDLDADGCTDAVLFSVGLATVEYIAEATSGGAPPQRAPPAAWGDMLRVFRGDCRGHVTDVTRAWAFDRVEFDPFASAAGAALGDVNGDGRLDLAVYRASLAAGDGADLSCLAAQMPGRVAAVRVITSRPDGTWATEAHPFGARDVYTPHGLGAMFSDVNRDGRLDLIVVSGGASDRPAPSRVLLRASTEAVRFDDYAMLPAFGDGSEVEGMGVCTADADDDGHPEYVLTNVEYQVLMVWEGGAWHDVAPERHALVRWNTDDRLSGRFIGWTPYFFDLERDGRLGIMITGSPGHGDQSQPMTRLLRARGADGTYEDASEMLGSLRAHSATAMTVVDLDGDAVEDFVLAGMGEPMQVLWNRSLGGRALSLRLRGVRSPREGIGARVTVRVGARSVTREMTTGGGTYGNHEARLFFGLGAAEAADEVTVRWPSGVVQRIDRVAAGRRVIVEAP